MKRSILILLCLLSLMSASACTDFVEPNQLAFVMGTAIDQGEDGLIEISEQIVVPSKLSGPFEGGSSGDAGSSVVMSATGRDIFEASEKIQKKMSRRLMTSHRILIAVSETFFNQNDGGKLFDKLGRDPANNLRDIMIVVKGGRAKDILMLPHPMENITSIAAGKELQINGLNKFSSRQLIVEHYTDGLRPLLPVLRMEKIKADDKESRPMAVLAGFAALNKQLRVKGVLEESESFAAVWMSGKETYQGLTIPWKDGHGMLSFRLVRLKRKIRTRSCGDSKCAELRVKAQAYLLENTTSLDMSQLRNMTEVEKYMNEQIQQSFQLTMDKVQRWGPDIFGIGEQFHRRYPYWWKSRRDNWDELFKTVDVTVKSRIQLVSIGSSGGPMK